MCACAGYLGFISGGQKNRCLVTVLRRERLRLRPAASLWPEWESFCFSAVLGGSLLLLAGKGMALFVARGVSVWLGLSFSLSLSFFFLFLVLVSVSLDEAGFLVQTPGVYLSRLGFLGINMRVFAGFCNAEQLVFGRFKAEPPPFGFKLGFRCDSLGSSLFCCSGLPSDQSRQFFGYRRNAMVPGNLLRFLVDSFSCQPRD